MDAELVERVNELYAEAECMARELNLRNEAMAKTESAVHAVMSMSRAIRESEDGTIFIEDSEIDEIEQLLAFIRRLRRPSKLTPIAAPKKTRKKSNGEVRGDEAGRPKASPRTQGSASPSCGD